MSLTVRRAPPEDHPPPTWPPQARRAVAAAFFGAAASVSTVFMVPFGLYMKPMGSELGWTRTQMSAGLSLAALVAVVGTPAAGWLLDRVGPRRVAWAATGALPLALCGLAATPHSYAAYLALCSAVGLIATVSSPMTYLVVLSQWVDRRPGLAISLAMLGLGLGQTVGSLGAGLAIAHLGWRGAWLAAAVATAVVGLGSVAVLLRENPARRRTGRGDAPGLEPAGATVGQALRTPLIWLLMASAACICITGSGAATHVAAILTDRGASLRQAALGVAMVGVGSIAGRLATGYLLDRAPFARVGAAVFATQAFGLLLLWSGAGGGLPLVAAAAVGFAIGAEADIIPFVLRSAFGLRAYGRLFGLVFAAYQLGPLLGPVLLAQSYDRLGGYAPGLLGFAGLAGIAALLIGLAGRPGFARWGAPEATTTSTHDVAG